MKILHIGPDSQFVQFAAGVFEAVAPGANDYLIVTDSPVEELRFPIRAGNVRVVASNLASAVPRIVRGVRSCDVIVAHAMTRHAAIGFATSPRVAVKVWSGWGYEYYGSDNDPNSGLLGPLTSELARSLWGKPGLNRRVNDLKRRLYRPLIHRAASAAHFFSAPVPGDFPVFMARFPEFRGNYAQICYASSEDSFASDAPKSAVSDILIGNSASVTNNHLEVFESLLRMDLTGRRILVPLSLGAADYRRAVVARATDLFGSRFHPLVNFMPLEAYNAVIGGCGVVMMNHIRQQALGNIGTALFSGAHVVLNEKSPIFHLLRSHGAILMSMSELRSQGLPVTRLRDRDILVNRGVLGEIWGSERVLENAGSLVSKAQRLRSQHEARR